MVGKAALRRNVAKESKSQMTNSKTLQTFKTSRAPLIMREKLKERAAIEEKAKNEQDRLHRK